MKTILPLATISYNTKEFLEIKLNELVKGKKVQFWCFIRHQAEEDEKKDHFHVFIEPCNKIETADLPSMFVELDRNSDKPLKTLVWKKSDFPNWLWYGLHDKHYLASKGESRKYHYSINDLVTNDQDELDQRIIDTPKPFSDLQKIDDYLNQGFSDMEILRALHVPVFRMQYTARAIEMLRHERVCRGEYSNHEIMASQLEEIKLAMYDTHSSKEEVCKRVRKILNVKDEDDDLPF